MPAALRQPVLLVFWLGVVAAGCDSPSAPRAHAAGHEPSAVRACADANSTFAPGSAGAEGQLDLCGIDQARLGTNGDVAGLSAARARAATLLAALSQEQKLALVQGVSGNYVGNVPALGGLPALTLQDGPAGVARFGGVTAFPAPIAFAATWDPDLVQRWAEAMGREQRDKGVVIQLGPMMNLARTPAGGRVFEGFGEDPWLVSSLAARVVLGIQSQKVVATAKHFVGNEQETQRSGGDSRIDERTLEEIYYAPFSASIEAGVGAVMCSYNRLNGTYACENGGALSDLKSGLGFSGFVMSDWGATHSTAAAANAGLDLEMPLGQYFGKLGAEITSGAVPQARLDDMVTRILTSLARVGALDDPPTGTPSNVATSTEHAALARQAATESITLLKNDAGLLPLSPNQSVLVIGEAGNTNPSAVGGGSAFVNAPYVVSPLAALQARPGLQVSYDDGSTDSVSSAASAADIALIFVTVPASEGADRPTLGTPLDTLITKVAQVNPNTVVVLNTPGAVLMPWLGQVRAVLADWYPGQENGNAIASILYGDENPSGRLPLSFPASENDLPTPGSGSVVEYSEKLAIGYRALDAAGKAPLFAFGYGLSYTTFEYESLALQAGSAQGSVVVAFNVRNSGTRAGAEVAQLYLSYPSEAGEPPRLLRGASRLTLAPGETKHAAIELDARDLSCWSSALHGRYVPSGTYRIGVGSSSRDLKLSGSIEVSGG